MTQRVAERVDYADLMGEVEELVSAIEDSEQRTATLHALAEAIIAKFRHQLGVVGGRIYRRQGEQYVLLGAFGEADRVPEGLVLPESYPPIQALLDERTIFMDLDDPRVDRGVEEALGVEQFAAIEVGDRDYILAFDVVRGHDRNGVMYSLGILRSSINQRIRQERMQNVLQQARHIQASILPRRAPQFEGFDIFGQTRPMEIVGGDHYDFIRLSEGLLGVAISDVSGHGLPAALLVRDVHIGLRMGLSREFKITHTLEKLNAIIHQSRLTSRFVSMFFGEIEPQGTLIYVNAGHPPPVYVSASGDHCFLTEGGAVLGPIANATFQRGFATMHPGDLVVMYTDGIVEAAGGSNAQRPDEFGVGRLVEVVGEERRRSAGEIVSAVFDAVVDFTGRSEQSDDRTVVVIKRLG